MQRSRFTMGMLNLPLQVLSTEWRVMSFQKTITLGKLSDSATILLCSLHFKAGTFTMMQSLCNSLPLSLSLHLLSYHFSLTFFSAPLSPLLEPLNTSLSAPLNTSLTSLSTSLTSFLEPPNTSFTTLFHNLLAPLSPLSHLFSQHLHLNTSRTSLTSPLSPLIQHIPQCIGYFTAKTTWEMSAQVCEDVSFQYLFAPDHCNHCQLWYGLSATRFYIFSKSSFIQIEF